MRITRMDLAAQDEILSGYMAEENEMCAEFYHMKNQEQANVLYEDNIQFYFQIYCNGIGMETVVDEFKCYQITGKESVCMILCKGNEVIVGKGIDFKTLNRWIQKIPDRKRCCMK